MGLYGGLHRESNRGYWGGYEEFRYDSYGCCKFPGFRLSDSVRFWPFVLVSPCPAQSEHALTCAHRHSNHRALRMLRSAHDLPLWLDHASNAGLTVSDARSIGRWSGEM